MKNIIGFYKDFGKGMKGFMNAKSAPLLKGTHPPIWQTPGKLQYYRAEMEPYVPDEIKWQVKMPSRFAMKELKLSYLSKIQDETSKFLSERIKHDYLKPDRALSLDLTLKEAEILISANKDVKTLAEKGDLQKLHTTVNDLEKRIEGDYLSVRNLIGKVLHQLEDKENALYTQLTELGIENIKKHGEDSIFDILSFASGEVSFTNLTLVEAAIQHNHPNSEQFKVIQQKLHAYMGVKARYFEIKVELREEYVNKVGKNDAYAIDELKNLVNMRDRYHNFYSRYEVQDPEYQVYINTLGGMVNNQIRQIKQDFSEYEKSHNERERIYHHFMNDQPSESLDTFRQELLQHLAGSIIVKEHRIRYQKEQFDRFLTSLSDFSLKNKNQTLQQFCSNYAYMIEELLDDSHYGKCPKVEANYDDFTERTVRPFNATIFYYFFSGDRRRRSVAQWLLASVRYPNDRVRRAYMRFFA